MIDYSNKFWKTATIFISSTFMDMNGERDILNNYVLPKLNESLNSKRINVQFIDLRWGIRTGESVSEDERDNKVLSVCFTEIARSQPFFVALLGDRYGYDKLDKAILDSNAFRFNSATDNQNLYNKSVTELEIMYGVFSHPEYQIPKALFFFRQANYAGMSDDTKEKFTEGKSKIDYLKKLISDKCSENKCRDNVISYHVSDWDESKRRFRSFNNNDFGDLIYLHLYKKILEHFESQDVSKMILPEQLRFEQESFLYNTGNAIGVEERIEALLSNSRLLNIIRGESGIGKTTLLKHLAKYLNNRGSKRLVLYYNAALSAKHREIKNMMLCCMCQMLKDSNELYHDIESRSEEEILDILEKELVNYKNLNYEIYFVIDSYESLYNCSIAKNLPFLGYATKSFVSIQNDTKIHFQKDVDSQILSLRGLNIKEAETMMKDLFETYQKEWNIELWSNIRNKFDSVINPLWIELAVNILLSLSAPDFNKIDTTKSSTVSGDEALERYLNSLVKEFPDKVGSLFGYYFNKLFEDNDLPFSNQFMLWCLSLSRNGIRENDLAALTKQAGSWDSLQFARLRYLFHSCIIERGTENCWGFSHNVYGCVIRDSINEFGKLTNTDFVTNLHKGLGHHYVHCNSHYDLRESECMYHLINGNDIETAAKYLLNSDAFKNDSKDFVHSISDITDYIIENKDFNIKYCRVPNGMPIPEISTFRNSAIDWLLSLTNIEKRGSDVARLIKIFAIDVTNELFMRGEMDSVLILNIKLISETPKIANNDERLELETLIQLNCSKAQRLYRRGYMSI